MAPGKRCRLHAGRSMENAATKAYWKGMLKGGAIGALRWSLEKGGFDWKAVTARIGADQTEIGGGISRRKLDLRYNLGQDGWRRYMSGEEIAVEFRLAGERDLQEFVIPAWRQSYSRSLVSKLMRADQRYAIGREAYWSAQTKRINDILASAGTRVVVAHIGDVNVGFCCENRAARVLHYVYVKEAFRKQGIGRQLAGWVDEVKDGMIRLTHLPPPWYSRPQAQENGLPGKSLWAPHVVIDLVSGV